MMRDTFEHGGLTFRVSLERDEYHGTPWDEEDGHGPVSEWTHRAKRAGELILSSDRGSRRLYDFAEACHIARRDRWGFLPGELKTEQHGGKWRAWVQPGTRFESVADDINTAISGTYSLHRAAMTARQYAAGAAMADYERLRAWCHDEWGYVRVVVSCDGESESCWGIEPNGDYLQEVAEELAGDILERIGAKQAVDIAEARPDLAPQWEGAAA
jgi:hypothetical protein